MGRKKKKILVFLFLLGCVLILCMIGGIYRVNKGISTSGKAEKTVVVIDPGHGGIDPGKVGAGGSYEKDINLSIAKYLKEQLQKEKIEVIMTRETDEGLYQESDVNKKRADMRARMDIMNRPEVDMIVSIHQNSFSAQSSKGAQVFYQASSETGKMLAEKLQEVLISEVDQENRRQPKANNSYYILKKSEKTAVIVECGFLSNPQEEKLLLQEDYQKKIAKAVKKGILEYLAQSGKEKESDNTSGADQEEKKPAD